jgi:hypothetical protein
MGPSKAPWRAPLWSSQFGWQYAELVPKSSLEELLDGLADVLRTLTANEARLLQRVQQLRSSQPISPTEEPRRLSAQQVVAAPASAPYVATPTPVLSPPSVQNAPSVRSVEPAAGQASQPPQNPEPPSPQTARTQDEQWPVASGVESAAGKRDYDFFAELDKKLSALQRR